MYDEVAEQAVLGVMLEDNSSVPHVIAILKENPDAFHNTAHQVVYQAILTVYAEHHAADALLVAHKVNRQGDANRIGGLTYLYDLVESAPETKNVKHYATIVKDTHTKRQLYRLAAEVSEQLKRPFASAESILADMRQGIIDIDKDSTGDTQQVSGFMKDTMVGIEERFHGKGTGLATGFRDLDLMTNGFQPADYIIIAARPSMGKSILAHNIACNVAIRTDRPALLFSLEMSKESVLLRMIASEGKVLFSRLRSGSLSQEDWSNITHASSMLHSSPMFINDTPALTLSAFRAECERMKAAHPNLGVVIVDYLQLMRANSVRRGDLYSNTTEISQTLKSVARELSVPVVALSQLSRSIEKRPDPKPVLSDLRESGSLEQDADIVAFIHRDDYYMDSPSESTSADLIIKKQRNGPTGTVKLGFNRREMRFSG